MNIGFLRSTVSMEDLQEEMAALERAGCERIIVDTDALANFQAGMLGAVIGRLADGDSLIVWNLGSVANSVPELIDLALQLDARNVRFRSLTEGFDTHGRNRAATRATLTQLQEMERQLRVCRKKSETQANLVRRVGRPRSLSAENIECARQFLKEGRTLDEVATEFRVSRATLYRYLEKNSP